MDGKRRNAALRGLPVPLPFLLVFVLAVLLPSIALSLLALRAADREAVYVERSLEAALLAEVNLAAQKISALLDNLGVELKREAEKISGPEALEGGVTSLPPAAFPFFVKDGRLFVPEVSHSLLENFLESFGPFLEDREEMQVYDSIAGFTERRWGRLRSPFPTGLFSSQPWKKKAPGRIPGRASMRNCRPEPPAGWPAPSRRPLFLRQSLFPPL